MESFKSGFEPPGDFPFEDFSQNLSRTGSDGTISSTPKGDRDKDGAPGPRSDPKHPMSRTKNKLWLFGKKPKVQAVTGACCSFESAACLSNEAGVSEDSFLLKQGKMGIIRNNGCQCESACTKHS